MPEAEAIVEVDALRKAYKAPGGGTQVVLDDVSLAIRRGEAFGLAGLSGAGKSTLGRVVVGLVRPTSGDVRFEGRSVLGLKGAELRAVRSRMQMVFQNPMASMNPRRTARSIVEMPLKAFGIGSAGERRERVRELLDLVGLNPRHAEYYPHEFSGGQCQRLGIARALATNPSFLFLDEPVSALDVSIQAQILNLLKDLQERLGLTYLLVANNLTVARYIADRIAIVGGGRIVEIGATEEIFQAPRHPITRNLLAAILSLDSRSGANDAERPPVPQRA
jgi:ABC-type oligopeptide transport system ATPase subunit